MSVLAERVDAMRRTARIIAQRPARFLLGVMLCALAFSLPLLLVGLTLGAAPAWRTVDLGPEVSIFLRIGTPAREIDALRSRLSATDGVVHVRLIPRDQAFSDLRKRSGLGVGANDLRSNPLPDVLVVRFGQTVDPADVDRTAATTRQWPSVDAVQADIDWYRRLVILKRLGLRVVVVVGVLAVALVLVGLLAGAQAVIQVRHDEAELLRLVGARPSFVRRPYAYAGALSAACGAALGIGIAVVAHDGIAPHWAATAQALGLPLAAVTLPVGLAAGFVLAAGVLGGLVGGLAARGQMRNGGVK